MIGRPMKIDYSPFLHVLQDGRIWWRLEDAVKLGAGYLPVRDDEHNLIPALRAKNTRVRANERILLSEFSQDHYTEAHPRLLVRDDGRFVEAHEFLNWLSQYITQTQSEIPFPKDLIRAVRDAVGPPVARRLASFESLSVALEGYFDKPLDELPNAQRERVECDFFPMPWDGLSPDQRRGVAAQWDYQHDPATEERRTAEWEEFIVDWDYWQKLSSLTDQEFCILRHVHDPRKFDNQKTNTPGGIGKTLGERVSDDVRIIERSLGADTKKHIKEWVLWAQQQRWDIPLYLRALESEDGIKSTAQDESGKPCYVFLAMEKLTADELCITFVGDKTESGVGINNMLEISARGVTKRVALAALELVNRQRGGLNAQGGILLGMAQKRKLLHTNSNATNMMRLRKILRIHLGTNADPFYPYRKGIGWEPIFKVTDDRGKADERAKREAGRSMVSYELMHESSGKVSGVNLMHPSFDAEDDVADVWLKDNDPNEPA